MYFWNMATGTNIKALRKSRGWTQAAVAGKIGVTQQVIASYEADKKKPPIDRVQQLAAVFGVSIDEIIGTKPLGLKPNGKHVHGNSRSARMQELFDRLPPLEQRSILKQVAALVDKYGR